MYNYIEFKLKILQQVLDLPQKNSEKYGNYKKINLRSSSPRLEQIVKNNKKRTLFEKSIVASSASLFRLNYAF